MSVETKTKPSESPPKPKDTADEILEKVIEYIPEGAKEGIKLSVSIVRKFLCQPTKSGIKPTDDDCLKFIMLNKSRGLNPFEGDSFMLGYETVDDTTKKVLATFSLITAHQAFLKRAYLNPAFEGIESGVFVLSPIQMPGDRVMFTLERNDNVYYGVERQGDYFSDEKDASGISEALLGGWAIVRIKGREPIFRRSKLSVYSTGKSRWQKDPGGMIVKVAEADALRSAFPSILGGLYTTEEFWSRGFGGGETPTMQPKPLELPHNRFNVRANFNGGNGSKQPAPEPIPAEPQTLQEAMAAEVPADPVPEPVVVNENAVDPRQAMVEGFLKSIDEATKKVDLLRIAREMERKEAEIGPEDYQMLVKERQEKIKQLPN